MSRFSPLSPFSRVIGVLAWTAACAGILHAQVPDTLRYSFFAPKTLPQQSEQQGTCLAVSGSVAVVGSPSYDSNATTGFDCGAVKIYDTATGKMLHRLDNPAAESSGNFGASVAISGSIVAVGSYNTAAGEAIRASCS